MLAAFGIARNSRSWWFTPERTGRPRDQNGIASDNAVNRLSSKCAGSGAPVAGAAGALYGIGTSQARSLNATALSPTFLASDPFC